MKVVQLDEKKLVGLRVVCPGDEFVNEIPKTSVKLYQRLGEINRKKSTNMIGAFVVGDCSEENDGYWVCVEVEDFVNVPQGMVTLSVPAQTYAVINHKGPNHQIRNSYEILHRWMTEQGFERNLEAWHLEIMQEWGSGDASDIEIDLYDTIK
ncbi:GyrI-like domain-containing protein [Paenibacillus alkalitolerans]|uniref:GyrI-like domain-containing protein n=1 Tax=Paenibacillus alkalitolerans TaxID=2799335 RepID=UPI0018F6A739|nr:effector binding domain-containing protein [Paenibacillus alkalitolerans]